MQIGELRESEKPVRCAYCHAPLGGLRIICEGCGTQLHPDCFEGLGTCPTLGCGRRPLGAGKHRRAHRTLIIKVVAVVMLLLMRFVVVPRLVIGSRLSRLATPARVFEGRPDQISTLAFSPGGDLLASSSWKEQVVWSVPSGTSLTATRVDRGASFRPAFTRSGDLLTPAGEAAFEVRNPRTGALVHRIETAAVRRIRESSVTPYDISAQTDCFVTVGNDSVFRVYTLSGAELSTCTESDLGPLDQPPLALSKDASYLAYTLFPPRDVVRVRSLSDGRLLHKIDGFASHVFFTSEDELVVVQPGWNRRDHQCTFEILPLKAPTASRAIRTGFVNSMTNDSITSPSPENEATAAAVSQDGLMGAAGGDFGDVRVFSLIDGESLTHFQAHRSWVMALAFSPDGRWIASFGGDDDDEAHLKLWPCPSPPACGPR